MNHDVGGGGLVQYVGIFLEALYVFNAIEIFQQKKNSILNIHIFLIKTCCGLRIFAIVYLKAKKNTKI